MKTLFGNRHKQSGQASLEMILMLVIGVLIALGLIYRFNTAFRKYTVDMYGTYYRCLLETGELPGVQSVCKDKNARFAIANGRALINDTGGRGDGPGGGGGGGGGGGKGSSGNDSGSGSSGKSTAGKSSGGGSGGGGGGSSGGGSSPEAVAPSGGGGGGRGSSVIGRLRGLQKTRSTAVGSAAAGDKDASGGAPPPPVAVSRARGAGDSLRGARTKMNFEMDGSEYRRAESAAVTPTTATAQGNAKKSESGDSLRPRKAVEPTERKVAGKLEEDKGGGLEFGKLFRMFLIFAIIVGIIFFLGGQVLQISKSGER